MDNDSDHEKDEQVHHIDGGDQSDQDMKDFTDGDAVQVAATQVLSTGSITENGRNALLSRQSDNEVIEIDSQEEDTKAPTPLFLSSRATPAYSESSSFQAVQFLGDAEFGVVVPPVTARWEYQTIDYDPNVQSILKELKETKVVRYIIETRDGRSLTVSFDQLLQLPGGPSALRRFENRTSSQSENSESSDSEANMVSARALRSRRPRQSGFVDITQIDISDEDELGINKATTSRPNRKRFLLSAPRPPVRRGSRTRNPTQQPSSSSEASDSEAPKRRKFSSTGRVSRQSRITAKAGIRYNEVLEEDDTISSSSADSYAKLGKRKRGYFHDLGVTRRSARSGRAVLSMRERGEDDIPETNTRTSSKGGSKAVGAKEHFQSLPRDDDFRLRHCPTCDTCNDFGDSSEKGKLVFCQGCTLSYHQACLGPRNGRDHLVTKVGAKDFVLQCRRCIAFVRKKEPTAPRQGHCQICHKQGTSCRPFRERKTARDEHKEREDNSGEDPITAVSTDKINNVSNVLFRCTGCYQAFHLYHLPPRTDHMIISGGGDDEETATERFVEYCKDWMCTDCVTAPAEIDGLIAWRPLDIKSYIAGQTTEQVNEDDKEYLVKWRKMSYYRVTWKSGPWVWGMTHAAMRKAFARQNNETNLPKMTTEDAVPEDFLRVDIVFEVKYSNVVSARTEQIDMARVKEVEKARVKFKGLGYEDVVWEAPPDPEDEERWDDWKTAYEDWVRGHYIRLPNQHTIKSHMAKIRTRKFDPHIIMNEQPKSLTGGELMKYQLEGLNWLLYQWHSGHNAILADEMGLGKTIQIIAFLTTLQQVHKCWPFLIVVPNSTCANWRREIKQWAPSLRVVTYFGSTDARKLAHQFELFPENNKELACHVVVTSYDAAQDVHVQTVFRRIPWAGLIVDEGQRLKNDKNILYSALTSLKAPFKVLLTGTPLQNNQRELFNLLQFLDTTVNAQALEEKYATLTKENVQELHELLRPFFLRRTKAQVLDFLPPMAQIIVPVTPSALQKQLYKSILAKDPELLKSIIGGDQRATVKGLRNLLMQLRKCLCHPFVYSIAIEERTSNSTVSHRRLVEASSKLQLLEIMLPKLKERGHRVLIFSQFLDMITIVEDFLDGLGLQHQRLDGTMGSLEKQKRIDEFNAPDSQLFALLLSTRAGGVGINLATADTVIILDPDFNPHQDIQAISRAHRIGQKKKVLIFQMMTRGTAEEKIMQIGKKKMALDHVLIEKMDADDADNNDLESVLRFGAEALFKDDSTQDIHYDSASVDKLLDRSQIEDTKTGKDDSAESQFSFARVWANESGTMEDTLGNTSDDDAHAPDPTLWDKILEERRKQAEREGLLRAETLGRGKRQRRAIDYTKQAINGVDLHDSPGKQEENSDSDTDFQSKAESEAEESAEDMDAENALEELRRSEDDRPSRSTLIAPLPKVGKYRRAQVTQPTPLSPTTQPPTTKALPCAACNFAYGSHKVGYCPLKIAGVEYCNLCGRAHYGTLRTCAQFNSETQVRIMLNDLKNSPESTAIKNLAIKYLRGLKGNLVNQKTKSTGAGEPLAEAPLRVNGTRPTSISGADPRPLFTGLPSNLPSKAPSNAMNGHSRASAQQPPDRNGYPGYHTPYQPLHSDPRAAFQAASMMPRSFSSINSVPPSGPT